MLLTFAIGLMSGTSLDGIDVALIETDGDDGIRFGPSAVFPYSQADRGLLRLALRDAANLKDRIGRPGCLEEAEALVTLRHAEAYMNFLQQENIDHRSIDVIGFHGQTVLHRPESGLTVQLGYGRALARQLGRQVVFDFRKEDVAQHGQGAPLVPVFHEALARAAGLHMPVAVINIGGVANLTFIRQGEPPLAGDCGPGNALIDDFMLKTFGKACDQDGVLATQGSVDETLLKRLLEHPFFAKKFPKSIDRNDFADLQVEGASHQDKAAVLTAFTAAGLARSFSLLPQMPELAIICGGGGKNPALMIELEKRLPCEVKLASDYGWSVEMMEAQAFGYLAVRRLKNLPVSFPTTTGVRAPVVGGSIANP